MNSSSATDYWIAVSRASHLNFTHILQESMGIINTLSQEEVWRQVLPFSGLPEQVSLGSCRTSLRRLVWNHSCTQREQLLRCAVCQRAYALLNYPGLPWSSCLVDVTLVLSVTALRLILHNQHKVLFDLEQDDFLPRLAKLPECLPRLQLILQNCVNSANCSVLKLLAENNLLEMTELFFQYGHFVNCKPLEAPWQNLLCGRGEGWFRLGLKYLQNSPRMSYKLLVCAKASSDLAFQTFLPAAAKSEQVCNIIDEALLGSKKIFAALVAVSSRELQEYYFAIVCQEKYRRHDECLRALLAEEGCQDFLVEVFYSRNWD